MSDTALAARIEAFRTRYRVPAVGAGVVSARAVQVAVAGDRVRGGSEPVTRDDRWHIGSCGKSMTAALFARLVERGEAAWAMPIASCFPDLAGDLDPGWRSVPVSALFVCESGLPPDLTREDMRDAYRDPRPLALQRSEVARRALTRPPRGPGRFVYSNLGYIVAGAVIERLTAMPFEAALESHLLAPLGMTTAGFGPPLRLWGHGGRMRQLPFGALLDFGRSSPVDPARPESDNPPVMSPAGRLHLTLEDWAKFHRVFLRDGTDGFLATGTVERLLTPSSGRGHRMAYGWASAAAAAGAGAAQQGSNTYWVATAMQDAARRRVALIACNEGSARLLSATARLAADILAAPDGLE